MWNRLWTVLCAGATIKIHAVVDGLGNPVRLLLTGGKAADITSAPSLIGGFDALAIVDDKGYDFDAFAISSTSQNAEAVTLNRKNRRVGREYEHYVYKGRALVERFLSYQRVPAIGDALQRIRATIYGDAASRLCLHLAAII